jgi:hypothetical protein
MKATELKFLILKELADFHEFRPSSDSWCSATSILKKLGVNDMDFARSVLQSLIEDKLVNHRGWEKLKEGGFELIIQPNKQGRDLLAQYEATQETNNKPPNSSEEENSSNIWQRPIGLIWISTAAGVLVLMIAYIFRHHLGIPL